MPITLKLNAYSHRNATTGEVTPGKQLRSITRTFSIHYRPSSQSATESRFMGSDGQLHNGLDQTITFPVTGKLPADLVWSVSYNTATSGPNPLGVTSPTDSLNVGLSPAVRVGHDRFPDSLFWDTRVAGNAGGAPFVTGEFNLDQNAWSGYVPAARFSTR